MSDLEIRTHPARGRPRVTWLLVAYMALVALAGGPFLFAASLASDGKAWLGSGIVFAALALSTLRWFVPTRYRFDEQGLTVHFLGLARSYPWSRFRSYRRERGGVFLSPCTDATRFDRFRGVLVLLDESSVAAMAPPCASEPPGGSAEDASRCEDPALKLTACLEERIGGCRVPGHAADRAGGSAASS